MKEVLSPPVDAMPEKPGGARIVRVLIVDDDSRFRAGIRRQLGSMHREIRMRIEEAESGPEALRRARCGPIDCVLLDYLMPGGDGLHWLERIREARRETSVILLTGHGDESVAVQAMKRGASDYLVKGSITPESLLHSILNARDKARLHAQLERQRKALAEAEKQRVMIQSLGAACHHLGQPATTLRCALELLSRRRDLPEDLGKILKICIECSDRIADILQSLQRMTTIRTAPYLAPAAGSEDRPDGEILDIA